MIKVGDTVRLVRIIEPREITDTDNEMRTTELFRFCVGREFTVYGFDEYGHVELRPSEDADIEREFGSLHTIWIEPECVAVTKRSTN